MTSTPAAPVFGVPEPHLENKQPDAPTSDIADHQNEIAVAAEADADAPGADVQWVNSELHTIASTIEELQSRLEQANNRLSSATKVETTEVEIGRLFVEAQRFSEASLTKLEVKIHEVLCEVEAKAMQILAEATEEAQEIRRQAQEAAIASTRTVGELQAAIAGFTTVNAELVKELGTLNGMLNSSGVQGMAQLDPSSGTASSD